MSSSPGKSARDEDEGAKGWRGGEQMAWMGTCQMILALQVGLSDFEMERSSY